MQVLAFRDVHEGTNETPSVAFRVPNDRRPLEQIGIAAVGSLKTILTAPRFAVPDQRIANARRCARAILGVNAMLPEADPRSRRRLGVAEKQVETFRPGKLSGGDVPDANCVIGGPGEQ